MSLEFPIQTRTIDPYASYNSDVVNRLTRLITRGENCLHGLHAIDVFMDSTSANTVIISEGQCFKDDVIISIDEPVFVDVSKTDYYINHLYPWNEAGYYWLCLEYIYSKSKPAPVAKIRILKPSQHHLFDESGAFLFLKALEVDFDGSVFNLVDVHNEDPSYPDMKRVYSQLIAGGEDMVPDFERQRDEARIIYVRNDDELYFGTSERWESFSAIRVNLDTQLCQVGQLAYLDIDGKAHPAISSSTLTHADCGIIQIGPAYNVNGANGKARLYGLLQDVFIEPGRTIEEGENVYLSEIEPGAVTDLMPASFPQFIGTCITPGVSTEKCDIWFLPTRAACVNTGNSDCNSWQDPYQDLLAGSIYTNLFIDQLANINFIDSNLTTAELVTYDFFMQGISGESFYSSNIAEEGWTAPIRSCQISSKEEGDLQWYVNNDLNDEDAWEKLELNKIHIFSEVVLELDNITGIFEYDERVSSSLTLKEAHVRSYSNGKLYLSLVSRLVTSYSIGETITGLISGATATITSVTSRLLNNKLRVRVDFGTNGGKLYDYGVMYNEDEDLVSLSRDYERSVDTLYLDVYEDPIRYFDGNPKLTKPLETQINEIRNLNNTRLEDLENNLTTIYKDTYISPSFDDDGNPNIPESLERQAVNLRQRAIDLENHISLNDNDIDKLFSDTYTAPNRNGSSVPALTNPLETQIEIRRLENFGINTFADGDTTPSVINSLPIPHYGKVWMINGSSTYTITNLDDGYAGQEIDIIFNINYPTVQVTIQNNINIKLAGGLDFKGSRNDMLTLIYNGNIWIEKSRSLNS